LREVHALGVLPSEVAEKADRGEDNNQKPENWRREESWDEAFVFSGETGANVGGRVRVGREEGHPDNHRARDGKDGVFGPDVGDKGSFAKYGSLNCGIEGSAPDPMASDLTVALGKIVKEYRLREVIGDEGVVEAITDPREEAVHLEKDTLLAKLV